MKTARFKKITLSVTMALSSVQGSLIAPASALTLLESSQASSPSSAIPLQQPTGVYPSTARTDRIIVKYRETKALSTQAVTNRIQSLSEKIGTKMELLRTMSGQAQVLSLGEKKTLTEVQSIATQIQQDPNVLYAEPDVRMQPYATPTDPRYNEQWHYFEAAGGINLPEAWDVSKGDGVVVAVIDSGIRPHEDLKDNILPGYDFITHPFQANDGDGRDNDPTDPGDWVSANECQNNNPEMASSWHGTHVAGTIAASTNNSIGVAGVAWGAKILPVRVLGKCGGDMSDVADSIRWAAGISVPGVPDNPHPAQVLNLSLGGDGSCSQTFLEAIEEVRATGATVVVAAGNSSTDAKEKMPASCPGVVTVAATKRDGGRASYSNFGASVDIAAPGGQVGDNGIATIQDGVLSTVNSGQTTPGSDDHYDFGQGTSMAAPHVAGIAALLYAAKPNLTPDQVEDVLKQTARAFPKVDLRPCDTSQCGAGIVDAAAAVWAVQGSPDPGPGPGPSPGPDPETNSFENTDDIPIPDFNMVGAISVVDVNRLGESGIIRVDVDVKHASASDLYIQLTAPNGASGVLKAFSGSGASVPKTYRLDASGVPVAGKWKLWVVDLISGNTGYIDSWKITFE